MDLPHRDNLEKLATVYLTYLDQRREDILKKHLSLDFVSRHKATKQLKLINSLPRLLYGMGMEIHLFDQYQIKIEDDTTIISPFQFEVSYTTHINLFDVEKITITINTVVLENDEWKIKSIISDEEWQVLLSMIEGVKKAK